MDMLDVFLNVKKIKLVPFLNHYKIDSSHYFDIEKKSTIETSEDMIYFCYLSVQITKKLVSVENLNLVIMQSWQLILDLYSLDDECEYCIGDLIEILLSKL